MNWEYNTVTSGISLGPHDLNRLGEKGWELVSHTARFGSVYDTHHYVFKRAKN